jgi:hypothetical protein
VIDNYLFVEIVQRPIKKSFLSVAQLNVGDGSTGNRGIQMLSWLQNKSNSGTLLVGFCELNGWQLLQSSTEIEKNNPQIGFVILYAY